MYFSASPYFPVLGTLLQRSPHVCVYIYFRRQSLFMFVQVVLVDTTPYLSLGFPLATVFYFIIYYLFVKTQYFVLLPMLTS